MNIILHGSDESRIQVHLRALKNKYKAESIIEIDAQNQPEQDLLFEMDSFSIFDDCKMIIVNNCTFLSAKDSTKYDIAPLIERKDIETIVVYICLSDKLDQRKKLVKEMISKSQVISCIALDDNSQKAYVKELCKRMDMTMDYDALQWFCSRVGLDSIRIESECEKLRCFSKHITLENVQNLVTPEPLTDVFKMTNALFEKKALKFLALYRNFRNLNMEPVAINGLLSSQIRFLFKVKVLTSQGKSKDEIASILKAHPYRIQVTMKNARQFSEEELLDMLESLATLDQDMKMGKVDKDEGFEQFALNMLISQ